MFISLRAHKMYVRWATVCIDGHGAHSMLTSLPAQKMYVLMGIDGQSCASMHLQTLLYWTLSCRQCSSGLQAIADVAAAIKAGYYTVGLAAGVETMSANPMAWEGGINPRVEEFPKAQGCLMPMGVTSENVAAAFGVSRWVSGGYASSHAGAYCVVVAWYASIRRASHLVLCVQGRDDTRA